MVYLRFCMHDTPRRTMPTGIASLDPVMEGGVPPGSLILLLGDIGAGNSEFVYSSILLLSRMKHNPVQEHLLLPEEITYVTFTKGEDDILGEMRRSFHPDMTRALEDVKFKDLSQIYFDSSIIPLEWYSDKDIISRLQSRGEHDQILAYLASQLNTIPKNSLVVLDSITDLATQYNKTGKWNDFSAFLRGLQRVAKEWNTTVYLLLTKGILDPPRELEVADAADAVLFFRWEETTGARRQRVMYIEKFRGLMPHLEEKDLVKFAVRISSTEGFDVSNIRVVI
jgi:KaiC/GvpD/RAD55 family RecA-like ATPase